MAEEANAGPSTNTTHSISSLYDQINQGGSNLSAGQKQLLCLARGLLKLRRCNILILDESTANLDRDTDATIQKAIREEIGSRSVTVLCIAREYILFVYSRLPLTVQLHLDRLQTIMDFDRVLVMSDGNVIEYDTPSNLLAQGEDGSEFARLCKETGEFARLRSMTQAAQSKI